MAATTTTTATKQKSQSVNSFTTSIFDVTRRNGRVLLLRSKLHLLESSVLFVFHLFGYCVHCVAASHSQRSEKNCGVVGSTSWFFFSCCFFFNVGFAAPRRLLLLLLLQQLLGRGVSHHNADDTMIRVFLVLNSHMAQQCNRLKKPKTRTNALR